MAVGITNCLVGSSENTLKNLLDATKSCYYLFYNYQGTSVDDLITYNDTSNVIDMRYMFSSAKQITSIPNLDTRNVTNMAYIFAYCSKLSSVPLLNTSNVNNMSNMFSNCTSLTSIPQLDTSKATDIGGIFSVCSNLTTVPALDVSNVTNMNSTFFLCSSLKSILMTGMKVSFDIHWSTSFETADLVTILNNLATVTSTQTLTMGATNLAKLSDEQKKIATDKGWTLA